MQLDLCDIIIGKKTYPNWTTGNEYQLQVFENTQQYAIIGYRTIHGHTFKRKFPRFLEINNSFLWLIGFIRGEGSHSKGKSGYLRFTLTNSDSYLMKNAINSLIKSGLINRKTLPVRSIKIGRSSLHDDSELMEHWGKELGFSKEYFYFTNKRDENKKQKFGTCHLYISDVLLRRVMDIILDHIEKSELNFSS